MRFSTCLTKRNHKVDISIHVKSKLVRENIYNASTNKIICQEVIRYPNLQEAVGSYHEKIYKFGHLGYNMVTATRKGKVIVLDKNMHSGIL